MLRIRLYPSIAMLGLMALLFTGCTSTPSDETKEVSLEESRQIAEDFVRYSPTFAYDGMEETLQLTDTITARCPSCWVFVFEFDSRHAGYGDRRGKAVGQAITHHRAEIGVEQGLVTGAVMDNRWDMMNQKII